MTEIRNSLESGNIADFVEFLKPKDEHAVASCLKAFLRELPESLVPFTTYKKLQNLDSKWRVREVERKRKKEI
jgi:hypothetical protein